MICQPKQYWDSAIIEPFLSHLVQPSPNKNISHCSRDQVSGGCYCLSIVIFVAERPSDSEDLGSLLVCIVPSGNFLMGKSLSRLSGEAGGWCCPMAVLLCAVQLPCPVPNPN